MQYSLLPGFFLFLVFLPEIVSWTASRVAPAADILSGLLNDTTKNMRTSKIKLAKNNVQKAIALYKFMQKKLWYTKQNIQLHTFFD